MDEASHTTGQATHPIDEKVLSLMDRRLETARGLADAASELTAARSRLAEAERSYSELFKRAEKAGWGRKELTGQLGFEEPGRAPRRRSAPRKMSTPASDSSDESSSETSTSE